MGKKKGEREKGGMLLVPQGQIDRLLDGRPYNALFILEIVAYYYRFRYHIYTMPCSEGLDSCVRMLLMW